MKNRVSKLGKKILSLCLVGAMAFSITACGGDGGETPSSSSDGQPPKITGKIPYTEMMERLAEAQKINPLAAAYMVIPGTNVDGPIILDNENVYDYWLNRTLEGVDNPNASYLDFDETVMFAEHRTKLPTAETDGFTFSSTNFVVFGHNWNNIRAPFAIGDDGTNEYTMLAQLASFVDEDFAKNHPYIYFSTPEHEMVFKVFSVMYTEPEWPAELGFNYIDPNLNSYQQDLLVNEMQDRSIYNYDVSVNGDDIVLTLSTCTRLYDVGQNQRFVISARLLREGETDDDETVNLYENLTVKNPNV